MNSKKEILNNEPSIILFDGVCNLCNGWVKLIIKLDKTKHFKFASLQGQFGQESIKKYSLEHIDSIILLEQGRVYTEAIAALRILKKLKGPIRVFDFLTILPKSFQSFTYKWVAKNRYRIFGKRESCMIPSDDLKERFLE